MKFGVIIFSIVLVLVSLPVYAIRDNVYFADVGFDTEYVMPGDFFMLKMDLYEKGLGNVKDTAIAVEIPELGIRERISGYTLFDRETFLFYLYVPDNAPKGEYAARITVISDHDEQVRRVAYKFFYVI